MTDAERAANRRRQAAYYRRHKVEPMRATGFDQSWDERLFEPYAVRKARLAKERTCT